MNELSPAAAGGTALPGTLAVTDPLHGEGERHAQVVTIAYGDEAGYQRADPALRDKAHARDAERKLGGR